MTADLRRRRRCLPGPQTRRWAASIDSEEAELALLVRFADQHGVDRLDQLSAGVLDDFLASRPRTRPRSFNHLLGVVTGLLDWAVTQEMLDVAPAPPTRKRRGTADRLPFLFDRAQARRLLDAAAALPDNPRALHRGPTYRTIFALCYGLGLRAGEVCGLRLGDVDADRGLLVVRGGKFGKTRLVPHGPRIGELLHRQLETGAGSRSAGTRRPAVHLRRAALHAPGHGQPDLPSPRASPRLPCPRRRFPAAAAFAAAFVRRRDACCAGIAKGSTHDAAAPAVHVHGPRRPDLDRGLPHDHPRTAGRGQPAVRSIRRTGLGAGTP